MAEHTAALRDWTTWVARSEGRLVGSVRARRKPDEPHRWWIGRLMVAPDLHGRGLGRALLSWAESQAPSDITEFWLNTGRRRERNVRMYRRAGYRVIPGESEVHAVTVDLRKPRR